jgi:hypothetical protein
MSLILAQYQVHVRRDPAPQLAACRKAYAQ